MSIKVLGIDLGKRCFHIFGVDSKGQQVIKKKLSRKQLPLFLSNTPVCLIGLEACGGAHYWAGKAQSLGHEVRLMPAQYVKPYVKTNKHDYIDAEAICEAVTRPNMRFVSIRSAEEQALGALVKYRSRIVMDRTATINQVHAFLLEYGIAFSKGRSSVRKLPILLAEYSSSLPYMMHNILMRLYEHYCRLSDELKAVEVDMQKAVELESAGRRLLGIPGVGLITACSLLAWVGDGKQFRSGRELAAWVGLVPKQYSTGGQQVLRGIGKRGHTDWRMMHIHGSRSALEWHIDKPSRWNEWAKQLQTKKPKSVVVVALANKLARMIWGCYQKEKNIKRQRLR